MDHERVNISTTRMSCGVMELSRIGDDIEGVLYALAGRLYHPSRGDPVAAFIYSDIAATELKCSTTNSELLTDEVHKLKFGSATMSSPVENPKTGNFISIYIWNIDHEPFKKWYSEERVRKLAKVGI